MDIRMVVSVQRDEDSVFGDRLEVKAWPVHVSVEDGREVVSDYFSWDSRHDELNQLEVRAQGDVKDDGRLYGERVHYKTAYRVGLAEATEMTRTLRRVEQGVQRLNAKVGPPESFAAYLVRVAAALKISRFGFPPPRDAKLWASGEAYRWETPEGVAQTIAWRVDAIRQDAESAAA